MKDKRDKYVEDLIAKDLMKELGINEERMLSKIEFAKPENKPFFKQLKFLIPTLVCSLLLLIALVSVISISVYKNTNTPQYDNTEIIYEALEAFEDEVEGFSEMKRINLFQVRQKLVCCVYYCIENDQYYLISYNKYKDDADFKYILNGIEYRPSTRVCTYEIPLLEDNELIIYENGIEFYRTNFKKIAA